MSEQEETSGLYDAPNQQVVRPDGSGPADEGEGGSSSDAPAPRAGNGPDLDSLTKDELLEFAQSISASPANAGMSKGDLRASIDAKLEE